MQYFDLVHVRQLADAVSSAGPRLDGLVVSAEVMARIDGLVVRIEALHGAGRVQWGDGTITDEELCEGIRWVSEHDDAVSARPRWFRPRLARRRLT